MSLPAKNLTAAEGKTTLNRMKIDTADKNDPRSSNTDRKDFKSKWDFIRHFSRWHFDKWKKEPDPFQVFAHINTNWEQAVAELNFEIDVGHDNYVYKGAKGDGLIEADFLAWGYPETLVQYQRTYNIPDVCIRAASELKLLHPDIRIHRQMPGMVAPIHADAYCSHPAIHKNPELNVADMRRFIIQMTDWDWGQIWMFGNNPWVQWRAGDVVYFESREIVHCTANAGKEPRVSLIVTGWMTDETREMIEGPCRQVILKI